MSSRRKSTGSFNQTGKNESLNTKNSKRKSTPKYDIKDSPKSRGKLNESSDNISFSIESTPKNYKTGFGANSTEKPKRGRGRPRKSAIHETESSKTIESDSVKSTSKRSKSTASHQLPSSTESIMKKSPKKSQVNRRKKTVQDESILLEVEIIKKAAHGRTAAGSDDDMKKTNKQSRSSKVLTPSRKRGRVSYTEMLSDDYETVEEDSGDANNVVSLDKSKEEKKEPKKRGRKKKTKDEQTPKSKIRDVNPPSEEAQGDVQLLPRKRGRKSRNSFEPPDKKTNTESTNGSIDSKNMEDIQDESVEDHLSSKIIPKQTTKKQKKELATVKTFKEFQCHHCDLQLNNGSETARHYFDHHKLFWVEKKPKGMESIIKLFKLVKMIECPVCSKSFRWPNLYRRHIEFCGTEKLHYTCDICQQLVLSENQTPHSYQHKVMEQAKELKAQIDAKKMNSSAENDDIEGNIGTRRKRKSATKAMNTLKQNRIDNQCLDGDIGADSDDDPDAVIEDCEEDDEEYEDIDMEDEEDNWSGEELGEDDRGAKQPSKRRGSIPKLVRKMAKSSGLGGLKSLGLRWQDSSIDHFLLAQVRAEYAQQTQFKDEEFFEEWKPKKEQWKQLLPSQCSKYMPCACSDIPVNLIDVHSKDEPKTFYLKSSEGFVVEGKEESKKSAFINAGGPVHALAWAPSPPNVVADQYLAVYAHNDIQKTHVYSKSYSEPCSIQLWYCGNMTDGICKPTLSLSIALDVGPVWCMKWCPCNVWQDPSIPSTKGFERRLGLLSMACANGDIQIYSVPHPSCLRIGEEQAMFKPEPSAVLKQSWDSSAPYSQCLSLDWQSDNKAYWIGAAYANGIVRLFHLKSKSQLIQRKPPNKETTILTPVRCFVAHENSPISTLSLHPRLPCLFLTGSHDRSLRLFRDPLTNVPIHQLTKTNFNSVKWWPHAHFLIAGGDDTFYSLGESKQANPLTSMDCGFTESPHGSNIYHHGAIWDIDINPWLSTSVSVDTRGRVILMRNGTYTKASHRRKKHTRPSCMLSASKIIRRSSDNQTSSKADSTVQVEDSSGSKSRSLEDSLGDVLVGSQGTTDKNDKDSEDMFIKTEPIEKDDATLIYTDNYCHVMTKMFKDHDKMPSFSNSNQEKYKIPLPPLAALYQCKWNVNLGCHTWLATGGAFGVIRLWNIRVLQSEKCSNFIKQIINESKC